MKKKYPEPYRRDDRGGVYYFTVTADGKRKKLSTGETRKERAREAVRKYVDRMAGGVDTPFRDYAASFFIPGECPREARLRPEGKNFGRSHMEASRYVLTAYVFTDPVFADLPMNEIRRKDVIDLRARLLERLKGKGNTAGKALDAAKTVLSEAWFREDIASNPGEAVAKAKYERKERGVFTVEELRAMLANMGDLCATDKSKEDFSHPRPRAEMFAHLIFLAGLRVGEARALRWKHIDLDRRRFSVVNAFKDVHGTIAAPKWDKVREDLAMPQMLYDAFTRWRSHLTEEAGGGDNPYLDPEAFVLSTADAGPVGVTWILGVFRRMLRHAEKHEAVKLEPAGRWLTPHSARHSLNTHLLASDVSALNVQQYLGWQSAAAQAITRVQDGYLRKQLLDTKKVADAIDELYGGAAEADTGLRVERA